MSAFNLKNIENEIDYLISINELGKQDWLDDIFSMSSRSANQVIDVFKKSIIVWVFYLKLSNEQESYELSAKIMKIIEIEKQDAIDEITFSGNADEYLEDYLDAIIKETIKTTLNK